MKTQPLETNVGDAFALAKYLSGDNLKAVNKKLKNVEVVITNTSIKQDIITCDLNIVVIDKRNRRYVISTQKGLSFSAGMDDLTIRLDVPFLPVSIS